MVLERPATSSPPLMEMGEKKALSKNLKGNFMFIFDTGEEVH
jgi:hypothetical protein